MALEESRSTASTPLFRAVYPPVHLLLRMLWSCFAPRFHVTGRGHLPRRGAFILTPNHISDADPPAIGLSVRRPLWYMAKQELFEMGPLGPILRFTQSFPVEPGGADRAALRHAEALLKAGQPVVIFPEGRCSPDGELLPLAPGVALIAARTDAPIIPAGVWGTRKILPYGSLVPRPTLFPVRVHFGPPLKTDDLADYSAREAREVLMARLETAIRECVVVARREAQG